MTAPSPPAAGRDPARRAHVVGTCSRHRQVRDVRRSHAGTARQVPPYSSYFGKTGAHVRRALLPLDDLVSRVVVARLGQPHALDLFQQQGSNTEALRTKNAGLRAKLDLAADQFSDDIIDAQQFARVSSKLRPQLAALEAELRASSTAPDLHDLATPDIAVRWDELPPARRRKVIALLLDIAVDPIARKNGRGEFDPGRVRLLWRGTT